jgi:thiazole synthase
VRMARAMRLAVEAGREAYLAGRMPRKYYEASPSSPTSGLIARS